MSSNLGFTGSRHGMTAAQRDWVRATVNQLLEGTVVHHGGCVGADHQAHELALAAGLPVTVHPPIDPKLRMPHDPRALWLPEKEYLDRDRDIVDAAHILIATPDGPPRRRSGTWYTINYANTTGRQVHICYPDGRVETR